MGLSLLLRNSLLHLKLEGGRRKGGKERREGEGRGREEGREGEREGGREGGRERGRGEREGGGRGREEGREGEREGGSKEGREERRGGGGNFQGSVAVSDRESTPVVLRRCMPPLQYSPPPL